jgi:hypothetical protein
VCAHRRREAGEQKKREREKTDENDDDGLQKPFFTLRDNFATPFDQKQ